MIKIQRSDELTQLLIYFFPDVKAFPLNLTACLCSRIEITEFAETCKDIGIEYVGLCCGNCSIFTRIVAEVYDKNPPASRYAPNMSKHYIFGDKSPASEYYTSKYKNHITI